MTQLSKGIILGAFIMTALTLPVALYFKSLQPDTTAYELIDYRTIYLPIEPTTRPVAGISRPNTTQTTNPTPLRTTAPVVHPTQSAPRLTQTQQRQADADALDREQFRDACIALSNFRGVSYSAYQDGFWSACVASIKSDILYDMRIGRITGTDYVEARTLLNQYAN